MKTAHPGANHQAEITEQRQTPLLSRLLQEARRSTAAFHTPGHHGCGVDSLLSSVWGDALFAADLPELPGLDNLFAPETVIAQAQSLASKAFGSDRTFFLTNGSTAGVIAAILAICKPGEKILLPRTIHRSVISGLILSGALPIFIRPEVCAKSGMVGAVGADGVAQVLQQHPDAKAVLIVSPTYEGICAEVGAIATLCHDRGIPLLVDEAHGPHFGFHPDLPASALSQGADLAVQSTHKVLSGLTQSAMLHLAQGDSGWRICGDRVAQALQLVQSTSPSYLLLASLDVARMQMATQGQALMARTLALAEEARDRLGRIPGLTVWELPVLPHSADSRIRASKTTLPGFANLDRTRLTVEVTGLGKTGFEVDEILNETWGVIAELPALNYLTFIISLGNTPADIDRLVHAFGVVARQSQNRELTHCSSTSVSKISSSNPDLTPSSVPSTDSAVVMCEGADERIKGNCLDGSSIVLSPREAHFAGSKAIALDQAVGKISAETVCPYPPGIPVLLPGEQITAEAIAYLKHVRRSGGVISGASDCCLDTLRIVNQP